MNVCRLQLHTQVTLWKSDAITMPMICSLIQHGFLPVFSIVGRIILYSKKCYLALASLEYNWNTMKTKFTEGEAQRRVTECKSLIL